MAVQPRDLDPLRGSEARLPLRLVPPPKRPEGRPLPAILLVVCLIAALGWPVWRAAGRQTEPIGWRPRPLPAAATASLDPVGAVPLEAQPRSDEPVGGMVFVSCTHLWTARPDGSHARKLLQIPGVSSPTFAPNARTIAFLAPTRGGTQGLFLVGADGTGLTRVGALTNSGMPVNARAGGLTWSPSGRTLGFALTSDDADEFSGGSIIFSLDLPTGELERLGGGWPAPFWIKNRLVFSQWNGDEGPRFGDQVGNRAVEHRISSGGADYSADFVSRRWTDYRGDIAVLGRGPEASRPRLFIRRNEWARRPRDSYAPPAGHSFAPHARPSMSEDGAFVLVELRDSGGERDLGRLDLASGRWGVRDYAWEPEFSTAPTVTGPLEARRAADAADDLLSMWNRPLSRRLLAGRQPKSLLPFRHLGHTTAKPQRSGDGWVLEAVAFGKGKDSWGYRTLSVAVREREGRLSAVPTATSPLKRLKTIDDAVEFLQRVVTVEVVPPAGLPAGTKLGSKWPVEAYSWNGQTTGSMSLEVPGVGREGVFDMKISYGDNYFQLGCGGVNGEDTRVGGESAVVGNLGQSHQIIWPAHKKEGDKSGVHGPRTYSVYGLRLPDRTVMRVAEAMEALR